MRGLFFIAAALFFGTSHAADRELAGEGNKVRLTISDSYSCSSEAAITITTSSAGYFDQDALTVQRLANVARAVLSFECPKISKIAFTGITDNVVVFKADAKKTSKWALETDPAPLEGLALLFSLYEPEFYHLGTINHQLKSYRGVSGISETYQFKALEQQTKRLISIVDGDTEKFRAYLTNPGRELGGFENALAHYADILKTIETYAPEHYPAYNQAYTEVSSSLKQDYWSSRVASIFDDEKTTANILSDALSLTNTSSSQEFTDFVDSYIANWIKEEAGYIKADLADASLYEISLASDFLAGLPDSLQAGGLTKTKVLLQTLPDELASLIVQRVNTLETLAADTIRESGSDYTETDTILETAFALAEEFEEAGYVDEGQRLLATAFSHIEHVLETGLQNYKNELAAMELNGETAAALQEQALVFEDLSAEFKGFTAYRQAVEEALQANKVTICKGVLKDASADPKDFEKNIYLGKDKITLTNLACKLYENNHVVTEFKQTLWKPGVATLGIDEATGAKSRFLLKADSILSGQDYSVQARLEQGETPITSQEWQDYIAGLVRQPPSGKADANGVRECDTLAADPHDSKKLAPGVDFEKSDIDPDTFDRAIDACIAAVENDPEDLRQLFQLGRLLWYAGDQEAASEYLDIASAGGYAPATYYKAEILLGTSDDPNAFIDALDLFEASGKGGYARGAAMVKELNPDGIDFYKEIPPPTEREIVDALPTTGKSMSLFGVSASVKVVGAKIKSCFQTSATDFSCEYKKVLECGMSGWGNDPMIRLMSSAMQTDCRNAQYTFDSFRKLDNGQWKQLPSQF